MNYWQSVLTRSSQECKRVTLLMERRKFTGITSKTVAVTGETPMYKVRGYGPITKFNEGK